MTNPTLRTLMCISMTATIPLGCMHALRGPVAEHHIQTQVIAEACEVHGYGEDKCTAETLRLLVVQACFIESITRNEDGSACIRSRSGLEHDNG